MNLRTRILIALLSAALIPLTITVALSLMQARAELVRFGEAQINLAANGVGSSLAEWLLRVEGIAAAHSEDLEVVNFAAGLLDVSPLEDVRRDYLYTQEVWLLSMEGKVLDRATVPNYPATVRVGEVVTSWPEYIMVMASNATVLSRIQRDKIAYSSVIYSDEYVPLGILVEIVSTKPAEEIIEGAIGAVGPDSFALLQDSKGQTIIGRRNIDLDDYLFATKDIAIKGLVLQYVQSREAFMSPVNVQLVSAVSSAAILAALVAVFGFFSSRHMVRPIHGLLVSISDFRDTKRLTQIKTRGNSSDEIGHLIEQFNWLAGRVVSAEELEARNAELEIRNRVLSSATYTLFHDVRGPLDNVLFARDLIRDLLPADKAEELGLTEVLSLLSDGVDNQVSIMDGLRDWIQMAKDDVPVEMVGLTDAVKELVRQNAYLADVKVDQLQHRVLNRALFQRTIEHPDQERDCPQRQGKQVSQDLCRGRLRRGRRQRQWVRCIAREF